MEFCDNKINVFRNKLNKISSKLMLCQSDNNISKAKKEMYMDEAADMLAHLVRRPLEAAICELNNRKTVVQIAEEFYNDKNK